MCKQEIMILRINYSLAGKGGRVEDISRCFHPSLALNLFSVCLQARRWPVLSLAFPNLIVRSDRLGFFMNSVFG